MKIRTAEQQSANVTWEDDNEEGIPVKTQEMMAWLQQDVAETPKKLPHMDQRDKKVEGHPQGSTEKPTS